MVFWVEDIISWTNSIEGISRVWAFYQGLGWFLEEEEIEGSKTISDFRSGWA